MAVRQLLGPILAGLTFTLWACKPTFLNSAASAPSSSPSATTASASSSATSSSGSTSTAAPTLTNVSPPSGPASGGTSVTVYGSGFLTGAVVTLGGSNCTGVTIVNQGTLTCTTTAHASGSVALAVNNTGGATVGLAGAYFYTPGPNGWIGLAAVNQGWLVTATAYQAATHDGAIYYGGHGVVDPANQFFYLLNMGGYKLEKYNVATGMFVGAVGKVSSSTGTCPPSSTSTGWCTGGEFAIGTGDGQFSSSPVGVAIHPSGSFIYTTDYGNHRVMRFNAATGLFSGAIGKSTASGTCSAGAQTGWCTGGVFSSGPLDGEFNVAYSVAIDSAGNFLYVGDYWNFRIQKFNASTGAFVSAIGKSTASGTCVAGAQTAWCTGGVFSTGSTDGQFNGIYHVSIHPSDTYLYVTDNINARIQRFNLSTGAFAGAIGKSAASGTCVAGAQTGWCTGGAFSAGTSDGMFTGVQGATPDFAGNFLYVGSNLRIQKFNLSTGAFVGAIGESTASGTCIAGAQTSWCTGGSFTNTGIVGGLSVAQAAFIDPSSSYLYMPDFSLRRIQKFNLSTGAYIGATGASPFLRSTWVSSTVGIGMAGSGDGMFDDTLSPYGSGLAIHPSATYIYFADYSRHRIQRFNLSTGAFAGAIGNSTATGTCAAGPQTTWCTGGTFSTALGDGAFISPAAVTIDSAGQFLLVSESGAHRIQKFNASTGAFVGAIGNSTAAGTCAAGVQTGWCTGGSFSSALGDGAFTSPRGVVIDSARNFFYVTGTLHRVQKFNYSTGAYVGTIGRSTASGTCANGAQTTWCTNGSFLSGAGDGMFNFSNYISLAIDPAGTFLYVADFFNHRVQKFNASTGAFAGAIGKSTAAGTCVAGAQSAWCTGGTFSIGATDGTFNSPASVAIDPSSTYLYVGDNNNRRIQKFNLSTGAFIGAIGKVTAAAGTCTNGAQTNWCTGGTFASGTGDGMLVGTLHMAVDPSGGFLYFTDANNRIQRFTPP